MKTPITVATLMAVSIALGWGCTTVDERLGIVAPPPPPPFVAGDAGAFGPDGAIDELTSYCPSNKCPADRVTCPDSRFPCDVNLAVDPRNCGACGVVCPPNTYGSEFACVDGMCVMQCIQLEDPRLDCDGHIDNGCEVRGYTNDDCGACGKKCEEPDKPCVKRPIEGWACGCNAPQIACANKCTNPQIDDNNCNGCGIKCNAADGGGKPPLPNTYFGCTGGECGNYKCKQDYADCNGDLNKPSSDGCETYAYDNQNCGGCGIACAPGQECQPDQAGNAMCACPDGLTYCGSCYGTWPRQCAGRCLNLTTDGFNCGGCGLTCGLAIQGMYPVCEFGSCTYRCEEGRADCNGNIEDFCEVKTESDPNNCGACGVVCDAVAGQACVHGRCAVEPCPEQEAGAPPQ